MDNISIFVFYDISNGIQSALSFHNEFKHCNSITFDGEDWIALEFDRSGIITRRIKSRNAYKLCKNIPIIPSVTAVIAACIEQRKKISWKPWWVRSCNEVCRYASGIDIGFTFNPVHFYTKLLKYDNVRNYEIIYAWRRKDGVFRRR